MATKAKSFRLADPRAAVSKAPGGTLEPDEMGGYRQPQPVRMRNQMVGSDRG
jgi:hypothetical protein